MLSIHVCLLCQTQTRLIQSQFLLFNPAVKFDKKHTWSRKVIQILATSLLTFPQPIISSLGTKAKGKLACCEAREFSLTVSLTQTSKHQFAIPGERLDERIDVRLNCALNCDPIFVPRVRYGVQCPCKVVH